MAELGANHGRSHRKALAMIEAAHAAGASAIKIQMYTPEQMTRKSCAPEFRITEGPWAGQTLYDLYEKAHMPHPWVPSLKGLADSLGLVFIASVYHPDMVEVAEGYGVPIYKISSFEISYEKLSARLVQTGKPVIISTGTATRAEIEAIVATFKGKEMALLKCVSQYPAPLERQNLLTIPDMAVRFGVPVGLSDHSLGIVAPLVAVSLGARIVEKHFKIDEDGFDASFSLGPAPFRTMVETIRAAEAALGTVDYTPSTSQYKRREMDGEWIRTVN